MKYFLIAGEASGDLHAAELIKSLRKADEKAEFAFLGGDLMALAAGCEPIVHYKDMAYMGFVDVLIHIRAVLGNMRMAKDGIAEFKPDALILIDYPSFNLRMAKFAHSLNIPVYYYISPKVWAWKENRVKEIRRLVKRVFSILPFEVDFYRKHKYEVTYVGNPSLNEVDRKLESIISRDEFIKSHSLGDKPIIALVPGSRVSEIKKNLPYMAEAARNFEDEYQIVIAAAPAIGSALYEDIAPGVKCVSGCTFELVHYAAGALVTSGTATLEAALLGTPQVVAYRAIGSKIVYNIFKHILNVRFVSLPNLILNREIVRELLLHQCTVENLTQCLRDVLPGGSNHSQILNDYSALRSTLGSNNAADRTAAEIIADLKSN